MKPTEDELIAKYLKLPRAVRRRILSVLVKWEGTKVQYSLLNWAPIAVLV